jgi:hypothetical protein
MIEAIEIFNDTFQCRGNNCLIQRSEKHSGHEAAHDDENLSMCERLRVINFLATEHSFLTSML